MNRHQPENVCSIMSDKKFFYSLFIIFALLAAAGSRSDEENQALLDEKVTKLTELSNKESVIRLTGDKFKEYVRKSPRNYSIILMLTALAPHRHCSACVTAHEEYQILANSWRYSPEYSNELFITMVDFDKTPDVFHEVKVNSVPVFMHFPAKGNRKKGDIMEMRGMFTAETMAAWIYKRTEILIKVYRPINFIYWGTVLTVLALAGALLFYLRSKLRFIFGHTCAILILTVIFAMISGYMWNTIRNPPKVLKHPQTGEVIYIHPNRGSQLIMETYVIMLLYGSIVVGFILMNEIESLKKRWSKSLLALAGLACLVGFFFTLLQVFKMKSPYYPYGFFDLVNDYIWKL